MSEEQRTLIDVGPALVIKPKAKRITKPKVRPPEEQARVDSHNRVKALYIAGMMHARRIETVAFNGGDSKAIYRLLDNVGEHRAIAIVRHVYYVDRWLGDKKSIRDLASDPAKYEVGASADHRQQSAPDATELGRAEINGAADL